MSEKFEIIRIERKFLKLARKFRLAMHLYGITEDVGLLIVGRRGSGSILGKLAAWIMVLGANLLALYVLTIHLLSEYRALELRRSQLSELFESLRSHLSRLFSLALVLTWHLNCPEIERLFLECQRYYATFHTLDTRSTCAAYTPAKHSNFQTSNYSDANKVKGDEEEEESGVQVAAHLVSPERSNFYKLAAGRVRIALLLPTFHFLLNLLAVCTFPNSSVGPTAVAGRRAGIHRIVTPSSSSSNKTGTQSVEQEEQLEFVWLPEILQFGVKNFHTFHSSIETAFHERNVGSRKRKESRIRSALYCLAELAIYSIYFHGPRIVCATCLSLILHIHQLCIKQLHRILVELLQCPNSRPLEPESLAELVKRYDLIRLMHERIERTFKWSIMLWFTLMFISCLMHIFSFTEMTTVSASASIANRNSQVQQQQQQKSHPAEFSSSVPVIFFRLASAFFVCYSPALIYAEAFRIEVASNRVEQLVMRLSRRPDDSLAQSIELSLFEPICLSVGEYFHLSKRSLSALLGATVTFSVMFIESADRHKLKSNTSSENAEILTKAGDQNEDDDEDYEDEREDDEDEDDDDEDDEADEEDDGYEEENAEQKLSGTAVEIDDSSSVDIDADLSMEYLKYPQLENKIRSNLRNLGTPADDEPYIGLASNSTLLKLTKLKRKQRRKLKRRLNQGHPNSELNGSKYFRGRVGPSEAEAAPKLATEFTGRVRENERLVELSPKLRILNQVEVCDFELFPLTTTDTQPESSQTSQLPFLISWIDRVSGEATLEARDQQLMDCERERNYTLRMRALGCNGLQSNDATVTIHTEDVNEFSPEFERLFYSLTLDWSPPPAPAGTGVEQGGVSGKIPLLRVVARDADCSPEFGRVCRYELLAGNSAAAERPLHQQLETLEGLSVDASGLIQMSLPVNTRLSSSSSTFSTFPGGWRRNFQVIAYDCAGKKSQNPAQVELNFNHVCKPAITDVDSKIVYRPLAGEKSPFSRAHLDLCALKCHRPNISLLLQLQTGTGTTLSGLVPQANTKQVSASQSSHDRPKAQHQQQQQIHCDRDTYSMVSRRRLCGAQLKTIELLPTFGQQNTWLPPKQVSDSSAFSSPEVGDSDNDSLNEYSLEGSYGKRAQRFASAQNWRRVAESTGVASQIGVPQTNDPQSDLLDGQKADRRHRNRHQQHYRARGHGRINTRHAPASDRQRVPDSKSVYRDQVYRFGANGRSTALLIPHSVWNPYVSSAGDDAAAHSSKLPLLFGREHSLSFWLRHSDHPMHNSSSLGGNREHLLCATFVESEQQQQQQQQVANKDPSFVNAKQRATSSSRLHHLYTLSVHNCKLILMMRRWPGEFEPELSSSSRDVYLPSEWRWTLNENQLCDDHWHLYTINVRYPFVELYVDGQQFEETYDSLIIVDDLPLSRSSAKFDTLSFAERQSGSVSLSLGACWDARAHTWTSGAHFRGHLSGLNVLVNATEDPRTVECMGKCSEALVSTMNSRRNSPSTLQDPPAASEQPEQREQQQLDNSLVAYQESPARILLNGHDFFDIEDALSQIAYVNKRPLPSIGQRFITLTTSIECQPQLTTSSDSALPLTTSNNISTVINIPPVSVKVDVQPSTSLPLIQLTGTPNLAREYAPFIQGIKPLGSLSIRVKRINLSQSKRSSQQQIVSSNNDSRYSDMSDYIDDSASSLTESSVSAAFQHQSLDLQKASRIEACTVRLYPALNSLHEKLLLPVHELEQLSLYWRQTPDSLAIYGLDSAQNYEHLLREIVYKNENPALYLERVFRIVCSDLNGRLVSNEYQQTVTIIHLKPLEEATNELNTPAPSALRESEWPTVEVDGENLRLPSNGKHSDLYLQPFSLAQSSRLDRIAVAFLVFLVSLVVIVLVIALTNLRERPDQTPQTRYRKRRKQNGQPDLEQALDYVSEDEEEEEEEDEEEEEEEDMEEDCDERDKKYMLSSRVQTRIPYPYQYSGKLAPHDSTDLDSLSWDEGEGFASGLGSEQPSIVINPLFHKINSLLDESPQQLLAVQRPDASGAMRNKPKSQLTNNHSIRYWPLSANKQALDDYTDNLSSTVHHESYESDEFGMLSDIEQAQHRDDSCFSAGSGSASSSSSGTYSNTELDSEDSSTSFVDEEDEKRAALGRRCSHLHTHPHSHQMLDEEAMCYFKTTGPEIGCELHHCHHHHPTCLRMLTNSHRRIRSNEHRVVGAVNHRQLPSEEANAEGEEDSLSENEPLPFCSKHAQDYRSTWLVKRRRVRRRSAESA